MQRLYEPLYRVVKWLHVPKPWVFGDGRPILAELIDRGRVEQGTAIDLGCGMGVEAVFLARHGFHVTGIDMSATAIELARRRAAAADVQVEFETGDLTRPPLNGVERTFDLVIDLGTMNDIRGPARDRYAHQLEVLTHPDSKVVLVGFARHLSHEERIDRFAPHFDLETLSETVERMFRRTIITTLMTRRTAARN